ncbi:MAG: hypothetical protein GXY52_05965 [Chloroflexi bacterium]|nr:hypothetical protein [Chloroflexota bacterium]
MPATRRTFKRLTLIAALVTVLILAACGKPAANASLVVLHTGDVYGYIEPCG